MPQHDPYASHLPVLAAVCALLQPRRILELGGGVYSTPFFLGLPCLEELVTVEADPGWRNKLPEDDRLTVLDSIDQWDYLEFAPVTFGLVFIDDGQSVPERETSIRWALGQLHPPTVVHDAEVYERVIAALTPSYMVIPTAPATAVIR